MEINLRVHDGRDYLTRGQDTVFITGRLAALHSSLNTYGKAWGGPIAQGWEIALCASRITHTEFETACERWLTSETDFPTPALVIAWIRRHREDQETQAILRATELASIREGEERALVLEAKYAGKTAAELMELISTRTAQMALTTRQTVGPSDEAFKAVADLRKID